MVRSHFLVPVCAVLLLVAGTAATRFGGFELRAERPGPKGGTLVVQAFGCHQPEHARVSGTAEGMVNGTRRTVPLTLKNEGKGRYTVTWRKPAEGTWVLALTGTYRGLVSSLLVTIDRDGQAVLGAPDEAGRRLQSVDRALTGADIERALRQHTRTD